MHGVVRVLCAVMRYSGGVMEDIREWLALVWQWVLVVWQWLLVGWQWLLAWPWGEWLGVVLAVLGRGWVIAGAGLVNARVFLGSADGWDTLGNVATVFATIWLVSLGREFVAQSRLTILSGLYAHMEELHRIIMRLQESKQKTSADYEELSAARKKMKNYFHDNRFLFSQNISVLKALETAVGEYGDHIADYEKTNVQYQRLRTMLEHLIHQRNLIERVVLFLGVGIWKKLWGWVRQPWRLGRHKPQNDKGQ